MRIVTDLERRRRLGRRHALAADHRVVGPAEATRAMTVLHATEPASVYLSVRARTPAVTVPQIDAALYTDRTVVKQLAMRRTLFVFPRDLLPAAWGSASARVADQQWARLVRDVERSGLAEAGGPWLERACADLLDALSDGTPRTATALADLVTSAGQRVTVGSGRWKAEVRVAPQLLTYLGARAEVVRADNDRPWWQSRNRWTRMSQWLPERLDPTTTDEGYAELVRRWLYTFGPGSTADLRWWLGSTLSAVRRALAAVDAVEVRLEGGGTGWVLPDDVDPEPPAQPWAALLPALDPTTMGWKERDFYLGDLGPQIFDSAGNAGTTAWWDGRIVGSWYQDSDGQVVVVPSPSVNLEPAATTALDREADRLTGWLNGTRVTSIYLTPLLKQALTRP